LNSAFDDVVDVEVEVEDCVVEAVVKGFDVEVEASTKLMLEAVVLIEDKVVVIGDGFSEVVLGRDFDVVVLVEVEVIVNANRVVAGLVVKNVVVVCVVVVVKAVVVVGGGIRVSRHRPFLNSIPS